jgi:hypothetical protein
MIIHLMNKAKIELEPINDDDDEDDDDGSDDEHFNLAMNFEINKSEYQGKGGNQ